MCAYLHAATSSAMKDPLTGLTGLELAVTQLRRCYLNKPFDILCQKILSKIETLSVRRSYAYDTEVVIGRESFRLFVIGSLLLLDPLHHQQKQHFSQSSWSHQHQRRYVT